MCQVFRRAATVVAVIAAALTVCTAEAAALDKLRVARTGTAIAFTVPEVGQAAKIWDSYRIELELIMVAGDAKVWQALIAGEVDVALNSGPGMGFRAKGAPGTPVAAMAGPPFSFILVVAPDGPIRTIADLKGKRVGVTTAGSLTDWLVRELSRQQGWGIDGIVSTPVGAMRSQMAAMKGGDTVGSMITTAPAFDYEERHEGRILTSFGMIVTHFHTHVITAADSLIARNPDLVNRFLQGWFKTVAFMKSHKEESVAVVAKALGVSPQAAAKGYDNDMQMMSDDGVFDPAAIEVIRNSLVALGILDTVPEAKALYSERFVPVKY
ncbi:MAG: nitrate/sulfonate/bicarbonate transporter substrate-binding protein [Rhodospirillales bacterium]|jgi:NitT/TauT family transport system substrate-binding protein|nr:nitrate/sulfonate/bicarbonate transporter substrate-binding protein [Rhodospirillales bacterium]